MTGSGAPVLIVDDNIVNLKLARVTLEAEGLRVATASDADEALAAIASVKPRVILMDLQLPGVDGLTLTRRLKADAATRDIAVIALTAYAMKGDEERAREAGCDDYVTKPIDTRALASVVTRHLLRGLRVLIVEDDPAFGKILRLTLRGYGIEAELADGLEQARRSAAERPPQLVLLDRRLKPDGDGLTLCRDLKREHGPRLKVILLTGSEDVEPSVVGGETGPDLYLLKTPETVSKLGDRIRSLLVPA